MALKQRHIMIIDDAKGHLKESEEGLDRVILSLPHPKTGKKCKFLVMGGDIFEIQKITPNVPGSWFVGDTIMSDGSLLLATRLDPLFILLPLLSAQDQHFCPLSQYLAQSSMLLRVATPSTSPAMKSSHAECSGEFISGSHSLKDLSGLPAALDVLCDSVVDRDHPDAKLYRINRAKATDHLASRVKKLAKVLHEKAVDTRATMRSQFGSFVASSTALVPSKSISTGEFDESDLRTALGILGEYLGADWIAAISTELRLSDNAPSGSGHMARAASGTSQSTISESNPKETVDVVGEDDACHKSVAWNAAALDDDQSNLVQKFLPSRDKSVTDPDGTTKKKAAPPPMTLAQKKLAGTNTKGMKSLSAFFTSPK